MDDHIEKIGLWPVQEMLGNEQMPRRGDWDKFRQSLDEAEDDDDEPMRQSVQRQKSDRAFARFLGADADGVFNRQNEDFSIADFSGLGGIRDGFHGLVHD